MSHLWVTTTRLRWIAPFWSKACPLRPTASARRRGGEKTSHARYAEAMIEKYRAERHLTNCRSELGLAVEQLDLF